jgi:lysophospholipase L1-like esterase
MFTRKIIITLFFALCAFAKQPVRKIAIVYIGDSITYGAGLNHKEDNSPPVVASQFIKKKLAADVVFANQGQSGFTTVDFLPSSNKAFTQVVEAARALQKDVSNELIISIMLGTNDSAEEGPNGSPVTPSAYRVNLQTITDSLLTIFPDCKIIFHRPVGYSKNTYNRSRYLAEGLKRLQQYFPQIITLVRVNAKLHPGHVFMGDQSAFSAFKKQTAALLQPESGQMGIFYLHPNENGAAMLGEYWAKAIMKIL